VPYSLLWVYWQVNELELNRYSGGKAGRDYLHVDRRPLRDSEWETKLATNGGSNRIRVPDRYGVCRSRRARTVSQADVENPIGDSSKWGNGDRVSRDHSVR
jgi:hypothetical protein